MKSTTFSFVFMAMLILVKLPSAYAQGEASPNVDQSLYEEIAKMDGEIFGAVNNGDIGKIKSMFTNDLEFYHDKVGLSDYDSNIQAIGNMITGDIKIRRALVPGSMKVFPVPGFGAIQEGKHEFFETLPGQAERKSGTFKFIHIWKKTVDGWKIARVVSYDH